MSALYDAFSTAFFRGLFNFRVGSPGIAAWSGAMISDDGGPFPELQIL
ncbi:MAG: hypothetical protein WAL47_05620 [Pyrinomonadaceae bacterium]